MRIVLQRVSRASVSAGGRVVGAIERGVCLLVGFTGTDTAAELEWAADKVAALRLFTGADGKLDLALADVGGSVLVVSQFTLYGDTTKGRRPSFLDAARPEIAMPLYDAFLAALRARHLPVESGIFGALMEVDICNDGPVTLILDRTA